MKTRCSLALDHSPTKRLRFTDHTATLPEELLILIFSFLNHEELYKNVRAVCKRWYHLVSTPSLWRNINVDNTVPTQLVCQWLEHSPLLEEMSLLNRNDVNTIVKKVLLCCPKLETLVVRNCWGSSTSPVLHGKHLCKMVKKCGKLVKFNFSQSRIQSIKFFELLGRKGEMRGFTACSYIGPINPKQTDAFRKSASRSDKNHLVLTYSL